MSSQKEFDCQCSQCIYEEAQDALLAKGAKDIVILRTALQELVDRRERAVAQSVWGGTNDGTDGRYKRAREALDATK